MAGTQHERVGVESIGKAAGLAVLALVGGAVFLGVVDSLLHGDIGGAFSADRIQYTAVGYLSTVATIGAVLLVYTRGVESELVAKAGLVVYGADLFESVLRMALSSSFDVGIDLLFDPLYAVLGFLGYVIAYAVLFERDIV
jgi:hypothetical protein